MSSILALARALSAIWAQLGLSEEGGGGLLRDTPLANNVHSRNIVMKVRIRCRLWVVRANNDIIGPVVWVTVAISKNEVRRAGRLGCIESNAIDDRLWNGKFIPVASFNDLAGDETEEIIGALKIAGGSEAD
jgi:hypothetical protein